MTAILKVDPQRERDVPMSLIDRFIGGIKAFYSYKSK